jgi:hypothetical protein
VTSAWYQSAYLVSGLFWLAAWLAYLRWRAAPLSRGRILRAGLLFSGNVVAAPFFDPEYWAPPHAGNWPIGMEDYLFALDAGAIVACLAARWMPHWTAAEPLWLHRRRLLAWALPGYALFFAVLALTGRSMTALVVTHMAVTAAILYRQPAWRAPALRCALVFGVAYSLYVKAFLLVWPLAVHWWSPAPPWGALVWGVPFGEIAWAFTVAPFWTALSAEVFRPSGAPAEAA